jgi:hypothetical protein
MQQPGGWPFSRRVTTREKIKQLTPRCQPTKTRREELDCFLCVFRASAALREMLLLFERSFRTFLDAVRVGARPSISVHS